MDDVRRLIDYLARGLDGELSDHREALLILARAMVEQDDEIRDLQASVEVLRDAFSQHESATARVDATL